MKYLLLAKANVRKTKGLTVGLVLLIMLAACFLNVFLLINLDFNKNAKNVAESLNTEDAYFLVTGNISDIDESYIDSIIDADTLDYEITDELSFVSDFPYGDGTITAYALIGNENLFNNKIGKFEILDEDTEIKTNYAYIPYQFNTGGGFNIGDTFDLTILGKVHSFKIRGFINTITLGSNNVGAYQFILSDDLYDEIKRESDGKIDGKLIKFKTNDDVNISKFINKIRNQILADNESSNVSAMSLDDAIFGRTFLGVIFGAILLIICGIVLLIVILMLSNNISNFIRENIKTLGALKALGYKNIDIKLSFITEFIIIDIIGSAIGIILSIFVMQFIGNVMEIQSAIPYTAHFKLITILITQISLAVIIFLSLLLLLRKTKKIEPIVALREGLDSKTKKKNFMSLKKSKTPLVLNLSFKTMYQNMKQNFVTFVVTFALIMMSTLSLVLYQNFAVNPKFSIMTLEICDGIINTDDDSNLEIYNYLKDRKDVENVRLIALNVINIDDAKLQTYILDNEKLFNNKEAVYSGGFPSSENEIVVSGKFAKDYGYKLGDEVIVKNGKREAKYKIVGFMQTLNNSGLESMMLNTGASKIFDNDYDKSYYFEISNDDDLDTIIKDTNQLFGSKIKSTMKFKETADGALKTFKSIASLVVVLVFIINMLIILLVLYMLIKTLINKKKKEYGILKSLGFKSTQTIFINAISFMPTIILSVVIASIVSSCTMNNIIGSVMNMFGIMKLSLEIPISLVILMGIIFTLISLFIAIFLSRKIKKIEPYKLLIGE